MNRFNICVIDSFWLLTCFYSYVQLHVLMGYFVLKCIRHATCLIYPMSNMSFNSNCPLQDKFGLILSLSQTQWRFLYYSDLPPPNLLTLLFVLTGIWVFIGYPAFGTLYKVVWQIMVIKHTLPTNTFLLNFLLDRLNKLKYNALFK